MYGKNSQTIGSALDLFIQEYSAHYIIILYATHSSDLTHILSLQQIVLSMGISPSRLRVLEYIPHYSELRNLIEHSSLHITFRYTAMMASISSSTPFIAIAYRFKTIEIADSLNYPFILRSDDVDFASLRNLTSHILLNRSNITRSISSFIEPTFQSYYSHLLSCLSPLLPSSSIQSLQPDVEEKSDQEIEKERLDLFHNRNGEKRGLYIGEVETNEGRYIYQQIASALLSSAPNVTLYQISYYELSNQHDEKNNFNFKQTTQHPLWSIPFEYYDFFVLGNLRLPHPQFDPLLSQLLQLNLVRSENSEKKKPILLWGCTVDYSHFNLNRTDLGFVQSISSLVFQFDEQSTFDYSKTIASQPSDHHRKLDEIPANQYLSYYLYDSWIKSKLKTDVVLLNNPNVFGLHSLGKLTPVNSPLSSPSPINQISKLLPFPLENSPLPIIIFLYSPFESENLFNKISIEESLTRVCKTLQFLSQNHTIILLTTESSALADLQSIWSFIRTASPKIPSVIHNVLLVPEVFEVTILNSVIKHADLMITTDNFGLSLSLDHSIPFFHLTSDYFSQETLESILLGKYSIFIDDITSSKTLYSKVLEISQNFDTIRAELNQKLARFHSLQTSTIDNFVLRLNENKNKKDNN